MTMPTFLIIGAAKAGTTSLYHYLNQHPDLFMSPMKETNFFVYEGQSTLTFPGYGPPPQTLLDSITDMAAYQAQFGGAQGYAARGEASILYLYHPDAPERIKHYLPDVHLIAILRHPAERAYSHYLHLVRDGREPLRDFAAALAAEPQRRAQGWSWDYAYRDMGYYSAQLKRYYTHFAPEQIKLFLYEDLQQDALGVLQEIFTFLSIDAAFQPDVSFHHNVSGIPQQATVHHILQRPNLLKRLIRPLLPTRLRRRLVTRVRGRVLARPEMPAAVRQDLIAGYRTDILQLQALIGRNLSGWLS